ncbi:X-box-binding protein 1 isoform X2 [Microcaecilia unicolor]|uniref:X-box-binding protein 1 n=1 Tax=Microcaecilia unicolor TaxID=1415580 RepID=A0A6P7Z849_9AMPH|nr:X-box-binding protein 1 isoform X2 [Microcaecilia unicolor]
MVVVAAPKVLFIQGKQQSGSVSVVLPPASPERLTADLPPRKRQRLTHLSPEEKALRRKLKNRVAAQTARDRKKARMGELEQQVVELEMENQKLVMENKCLLEKARGLVTENQALRQRLGLDALEMEDKSKVCTEHLPRDSSGLIRSTQSTCASAAGAGPDAARTDQHRMDTAGLDSSDSESDLLLGILDGLDPDLFLHYSESSPQCLQEELDGEESDSLPASPSPPLGTTSAKLEAINELIRFDHVYTKPLMKCNLELESQSSSSVVVKMEEASLQPLSQEVPKSPVCLKEEPVEEVFIPELGLASLLSSGPQLETAASLLDTYSDSGYEGSSSPFSDLSSPLDSDRSWEDTFANELFPQLISV